APSGGRQHPRSAPRHPHLYPGRRGLIPPPQSQSRRITMTEYEQSIRRLRNSALGAATVRAFAGREADPKIRNPDSLARAFIDPALCPDPSDGAKVVAFRGQLEAMLPGAYHFQN